MKDQKWPILAHEKWTIKWDPKLPCQAVALVQWVFSENKSACFQHVIQWPFQEPKLEVPTTYRAYVFWAVV